MKQFIQDSKGQLSSIRIINLIVVLTIMVGWVIVSVKVGHMSDLPPTIVALIASLNTGKAVQKFAEENHKKEKKDEKED